MVKKSESLEEGLDRSANKRHLSGKERHRYIGGALHNMGKSKPRSGGKPKSRSKPEHETETNTAARKAPAPTHKKQAYQKPVLTKREHLSLTARLNTEASKGKTYNVYSIYKSGSKAPHTNQTFRKMSAAKAEAKILQDESKEGYTRRRF